MPFFFPRSRTKGEVVVASAGSGCRHPGGRRQLGIGEMERGRRDLNPVLTLCCGGLWMRLRGRRLAVAR
jgi:hypothetical protein